MNWIILGNLLLLTYSHELLDPILFKAGLIKPHKMMHLNDYWNKLI